MRQPEEFPLDPRAPTKRSKDCQFCLQAEGGMEGAAPGMPPGQGHADMGEILSLILSLHSRFYTFGWMQCAASAGLERPIMFNFSSS